MDPLANSVPAGGAPQQAAPVAPANTAPAQTQQTAPPPQVQYPNIPMHPPSQGNQRPAPAVQTQQPAQGDAFTTEQIIQGLAQQTGLDPEYIRQRSNGNPLAWAGALTREAVGVVRQRDVDARQVPANQAPAAQTQAAPAQQGLPDWWRSAVQTNPQTGMFEPVRPEYQDVANQANAERLRKIHQFEQIQEDPTRLFAIPSVQQAMKAQFDTQMAQARQQWEAEALDSRMREKYGKEIVQHGQNGQPIIGVDGKPEFTQLGWAFARHYEALERQGMRKSQALYDTAITLARNEVGVSQAASQMQQQIQPGNAFGIPAQPIQQNQQYQGWNQPIQQPVNNVLQNANTYFPGGSPARQQQPAANMPIEMAMHQALANEPDGKSAGYYINQLFGSGGENGWN